MHNDSSGCVPGAALAPLGLGLGGGVCEPKHVKAWAHGALYGWVLDLWVHSSSLVGEASTLDSCTRARHQGPLAWKPQCAGENRQHNGSSVNRQGDFGSLHLCRLAWTIWEWAHSCSKALRVMYMPSQTSLAVDQLSRGDTFPESGGYIQRLYAIFGTTWLSYSYSRSLTHYPFFFSIGREDPPFATNGMVYQCPQVLLYASLPFTLLHPLLQSSG